MNVKEFEDLDMNISKIKFENMFIDQAIKKCYNIRYNTFTWKEKRCIQKEYIEWSEKMKKVVN